eukprot:585213_1
MPVYFSLSTVLGAVAGSKLFSKTPGPRASKRTKIVNYVKSFRKKFQSKTIEKDIGLQVAMAEYKNTPKMQNDPDHGLNRLLNDLDKIGGTNALDDLDLSWMKHENILTDIIDHQNKCEALILTTKQTHCCGKPLTTCGHTTGKIHSMHGGTKTAPKSTANITNLSEEELK